MRCARGLFVLGIAAGLACVAGRADAQEAAVRRQIDAAKKHIENLNADSAGPVLQAVLDVGSGASAGQRSWAYALLALVRLADQNRVGARLMFEQALRTDARLPVDSLSVLRDLESQAEVVFQEARVVVQGAARGGAAPAGPFSIDFQVARDTTLRGPDERLAMTLLPARPARTVVTVRTAGDVSVLWQRSDTLPAGASRPILWLPRGADGRPLPDGVYAFDVTGVDDAGIPATPVTWRMRLTALPPVTRPALRPLAESVFLPETLQVRHRSMVTLLAGAGLGAAAAFIPSALGRTEVNKGLSGDGTAYVVAGSVTVAGLVGFLNGRRGEYSVANARHNDSLRSQFEERVQAANQANELARRQPPIRLVREGSPNR